MNSMGYCLSLTITGQPFKVISLRRCEGKKVLPESLSAAIHEIPKKEAFYAWNGSFMQRIKMLQMFGD
jgi:uncharacterized protein involved in tolerance to divalent cations